MRSRLRLLAVAGLVVLSWLAAAARAQTPFDHKGFALQALQQHIRPLQADFAAKAERLVETVGATCQRHEAADDQNVKDAYRETVLAWSRTEHLRFGPIQDDNRFEKLMYWPDRQRIGERQVTQILNTKDPAVLTSEGLAGKSVAVQGLTALEIVLYGKTAQPLSAETPEAVYGCQYAHALSRHIARIAQEIVAEWADGGHFAKLFLNPGADNPLYKDDNEVTLELLKTYHGGIYNARDIKILPSLGQKRIATRGQFAPKSRPPFELSGLALATFRANVEGVRDFYVNSGLSARLAKTEPGTDALIKGQFDESIDFIRALEPSGLAVFNDPALMNRLLYTREPLGALISDGSPVLTEMAGLGSVLLGLTDDGD